MSSGYAETIAAGPFVFPGAVSSLLIPTTVHGKTMIPLGGSPATCVLPEKGPTARILTECARNMRVVLVAILAHGRPGLVGRLMGGVAESIVHHSQIPVLIAQP